METIRGVVFIDDHCGNGRERVSTAFCDKNRSSPNEGAFTSSHSLGLRYQLMASEAKLGMIVIFRFGRFVEGEVREVGESESGVGREV